MQSWLDKASSFGALPDRGARLLKLAIQIVCSVLLMVMMVLTVTDVLGRYLFSAPVRGATEVTELLLAAVIFVGLPATTLDREHVTVDLLTGRMPGWLRAVIEPLVLLASAGVLAAIAWRLWVVGVQIGGYNGTTQSLKVPLAPVIEGMAVLCGLAVLITLAQLLPRRKEHADG
ncbi:TRAP transporter small permease [Pararhodobacter zhoushanensis]|uniref:TRAP transporter small permease n=1 Tax=Pararhodobacter zhoushanensis TaxID=2479545 RepID=UPI000F8CFE6D|nr:TRAP transporter small permease [Pararhodobacter zhoushanensis]